MSSVPRNRLLSAGLLLLLAAPALGASRLLEPCSGACRVKLRSGRVLAAASLLPADEGGGFWRLEMESGGSVVLPQREIKSVTPAAAPAAAPAVLADAEPAAPDDAAPKGCDPLRSRRLQRWDDLSRASAEKHGLDPALVSAIIAVESCGEPQAVSPKGAVGLMQLMPGTAREHGCADPKDPAANMDAGCRHLAGLMQRLAGDVPLVLAAYNAGEGAVAKAGGIPKYRETQRYVKHVLSHQERLQRAVPGEAPAL